MSVYESIFGFKLFSTVRNSFLFSISTSLAALSSLLFSAETSTFLINRDNLYLEQPFFVRLEL